MLVGSKAGGEAMGIEPRARIKAFANIGSDPALMLTDTAFLRSAHYHGAGDTMEKLDYVRMVKVVQGVFALTQLAPAH